MSFCDIHAHFVYGMDDGARSQKEMQAMLDAAWADGVTELFATPHVTPGVRAFDAERFERHLSLAREHCRQRGYAMQLYAGAEILYTPFLKRYAQEHTLPTLGDTDRVLVEFAPEISFHEIASAVDMLERNGYTPVLAHIERYRAFFGLAPYRLRDDSDVLYQLNSQTLVDGAGLIVNRRVHSWLRDRIIDYVATDSHDCRRRRTCMKAAYAILVERYGRRYADHLTKSSRREAD